MKTIAIAGASGFIGKKVIQEILEKSNNKIIALSRSDRDSTSRVSWRKCDLFSKREIKDSIKGADELVYLVHSMEPSARLDQASFEDYDLILADNFGRVAQSLGIKKVIYLGGIIPANIELSKHLESRLEVERALKEYIPNVVCLRAGLILGNGGSSYNILINLVKRLPILICPKWAQNETSPVHASQVVESILFSLDHDSVNNSIINLTSKDKISYFDLLRKTARYLNKKRKFFKIGVPILTISRFWVSLFSGASRRLVYPLLESLRHPMLVDERNKGLDVKIYSVDEALEKTVQEGDADPYKFKHSSKHESFVRSVQRAKLPGSLTAKDAAHEYMIWLPRFLFPFIIVTVDGPWITFSVIIPQLKILILKRREESTSDLQTFKIKGGLLALKNDKGRLEFREVLDGKYLLMSIHDFYPSLPWYIYRYSQALMHLFVMNSFKKYLSRLGAKHD
jgi:nucleoside-diphosphate-sugar epimerase